MKPPLTQILILVFLVFQSFPTAEGLICHQCSWVRKDNKCRIPSTCNASTKQFCFIQRNSKEGHIKRIRQGCTSYCIDTIQFSKAYIRYTFCCKTDYCNKYNVWQFL